MALESLASTDAALPYSFSIDRAAQPWSIDLRPTIREIVSDLLEGRDQRLIASRFHVTLVSATTTVIDAAAERHGRLPVVLSGGCMQNEPLVAGLVRALGSRFRVFRNELVPPGDGGIALGQAVVADAVFTAGGA
jgi:hydrogenase maturation protein HypF